MLLSTVLDLFIFDSDWEIMSDATSLLQLRKKNCCNFAHSTGISSDMSLLVQSIISDSARTITRNDSEALPVVLKIVPLLTDIIVFMNQLDRMNDLKCLQILLTRGCRLYPRVFRSVEN